MNFSLVEFVTSAASFLLVWFVLGNYVFKPFFALLEERERKTEGSESVAKETKVATQNILVEIEDSLREVRAGAATHKEARIQKARKEAQSIVDLAANKAEKDIKSAQVMLNEKRDLAFSDLPEEVEAMSDLIVNKALSSGSNITIH